MEPQRPTPEQHLLCTLEVLVDLLGTFTDDGSPGGNDLALDTNVSLEFNVALGFRPAFI